MSYWDENPDVYEQGGITGGNLDLGAMSGTGGYAGANDGGQAPYDSPNQGYNEQQGPPAPTNMGNYQAQSGWDPARMNDPNTNSGKYDYARWMQDNGYGQGGKAYGADAVRAFIASDAGQGWEMQGSPDDPQIRQKQSYLDQRDPGRESRWQDVIQDSGPGGKNLMSFANAETRPGEGGGDYNGIDRASGGGPGGGGYGGGNYAGGGGGSSYRGQAPSVLSQRTFDPYQYEAFTPPEAFKAPGEEGMKEDPGYQFRLKQGLGSMQNSAAAKGTLFGGATLKGLNDYAAESASQEYGNVYGRRANEYDRSYQNAFQNNQAGNQGRLAGFQANTGAALAQGNLDLGYTQAGNSYSLGMGNLALGNKQADQGFYLGQGNLALNQQGQAFNQAGQTFDRNYGVYRDNRDTAFNQNYALAGLGQNAASGYGNQVGNAYTNQGNANGASQIAQGNAWSGAIGNLANMGGQYAANYWNQPRYGAAGAAPGNYGYG